jgi:hypothetical protein
MALVVVVLASTLATLPGALGASPSYTLTGYVRQPGPGTPAVPSGVQVDLVSQGSGTVYTTTTTVGGGFTFSSASTGGALQPGYWGLWVPPQTNRSFGSGATLCFPCAALSVSQNPVFKFENATALTTSLYNPILSNVQILYYNATQNGTVTAGGSPLPGANVRVLAPMYNGVVLVNNTTASNGAYSLKVPWGTWVLQATAPGPAPNYVNSTQVVISSRTPPSVNPVIRHYLVSGTVDQLSGSPVPSSGNVTLYDPTNRYVYSAATPPGGYYQIGTYPSGFVTSGSQTFDVFLATVGYSTTWYSLTVSSPSLVEHNVEVPLQAPNQLGVYLTTLNFSSFNVAKGTGTLNVSTTANLGNDTVLPNLPNGTVGQLWTQLGLDFANSVSFPSTSLSSVYAWENASGPFFPAVQAGTTINGTGFLGLSSPQGLTSETSTCSGTCDASSTSNLTLGWSTKYTLNGTLYKNSSSYTIGFNFRHPSSSADVYNYSVILPSGYVLRSGTSAPIGTRLVAAGPGGTWTKFTLQSLPSLTPSGAASFTIVRYSALTAIVNATVSNFAFSSLNVLNSTNGNYTVEVGLGQNVTFSAQNTLYPAGNNGTKFAWTFGDSSSATVTTATTSHIYLTGSANEPFNGTLKVWSSGGLNNTTKFHVWVATGPVTAGILSNATAAETKSVSGTTYLLVNWSTILRFNATGSKAEVSPSTTKVAGVLSVASYTLVSKGFKQVANYSVGSGAQYWQNWSVQFLGAGSYLTNGTVNGAKVPFKGWQYNLTLTVWSGTGQSASTTLVILVNDTEKPVPAFQILTLAGKPVSGSGIVAGSNLSVQVQLNGANASDPHNGSIGKYYWHIYNSGNTSFQWGTNISTVKPYPKPWLPAQSTAYTVNLTVWDLNGNKAWTTQSLTVSANSTTTPIMGAYTLTGPAKLTQGTSYTFWINVTVGGGKLSVAHNVTVRWYTTSPGGTSQSAIAGTPGSVRFYNYTSPGVANPTPFAVGRIASLAWNVTVRAEVTWSPGTTGNFNLYANVTATNEFAGDYSSATNVAQTSITVGPNPTTQLLEYVAIGVAVVVVILLIIVYYRRRSGRGGAAKPTGRAGLERGSKRPSEEEEDEEESS